MFGTLLGGLPWPDGVEPGDTAAAVEAAIRAQEAAGIEPITDGRLGPGGPFALEADRWAGWSTPVSVAAWRDAAALTDRAVKQALPGPYSLAAAVAGRGRDVEPVALAIAAGLRREVEALADAGCPLVEIEETDAHRIGDRPAHRRAFADAHRRLAMGVTRTHLSLSMVGGSAWEAGVDTILAAPYASLAVDLIAGPDNWRLVALTPGDRGIVAGALSPAIGSDDTPELLLFAANYAASTNGRGSARVGLGIAGSLAALTWEQAVGKLARLAKGLRIASLPPGEELSKSVDPRAINIRSAAYGRPMPLRPERGGRGTRGGSSRP
jgi:hypothetical protein